MKYLSINKIANLTQISEWDTEELMIKHFEDSQSDIDKITVYEIARKVKLKSQPRIIIDQPLAE